MAQLSVTYFLLVAAAVAAVLVAAAAAAADPDTEADPDSDADPMEPPVTDNPRCKHPLFCRQRPSFGTRLRPLLTTTTPPSTTTVRRPSSRFGSRPTLYNREDESQTAALDNVLEHTTKMRPPTKLSASFAADEAGDPQTAEIEDFKGSEEGTTINVPSLFRRNRQRLTATTSPPIDKKFTHHRSKSSPSGSDSEITTIEPVVTTARRRLPLTMARHRTTSLRTTPKSAQSAEIITESFHQTKFDVSDELTTTLAPTTVEVDDCSNGQCLTPRPVPGRTVVVRRKKISPNAKVRNSSAVTSSPSFTSVSTESTFVPSNVDQHHSEVTTSQETFTASTRRPFASKRIRDRFNGRLSQRLRAETQDNSERDRFVGTKDEADSTTIGTPRVRKVNERFKGRKKITTTTESIDNTEPPTTQSWYKASTDVTGKPSAGSKTKCGRTCKDSIRHPLKQLTTTPEPENYPAAFLLAQSSKTGAGSTSALKSFTQERPSKPSKPNHPVIEEQTTIEYESKDWTKGRSPPEYPPPTTQPVLRSREPEINQQYLQEVTAPVNQAIMQVEVQKAKDALAPNTFASPTKKRTGKETVGDAVGQKDTNGYNYPKPNSQFSENRTTQPAPTRTPESNKQATDFVGYNYPKPQSPTVPPTTPNQTTKKPSVVETPKTMGYFYPKAATPATFTTSRPLKQPVFTPMATKMYEVATPMAGFNGYSYPKTQMPFVFPTTMKPIMQESTFLPMLIQKKQEVLENTPFIGPAMTTVRNILKFITNPEQSMTKTYPYPNMSPQYPYPSSQSPKLPQTTYPPHMNFPPYPPRSSFQKQTSSVDNGFKLVAKPRKHQKGFDENRTFRPPSGFDASSMRPASSPRPSKKHMEESYTFQGTKPSSSRYHNSAKPLRMSTHHHYKMSSGNKSSVRKTRTRSSRNNKCHHKHSGLRPSRQNTFRHEDMTMFVPIGAMMTVREPLLRNKRQSSGAEESEGYVYPRPAGPQVTFSPSIAPVTTPETSDITSVTDIAVTTTGVNPTTVPPESAPVTEYPSGGAAQGADTFTGYPSGGPTQDSKPFPGYPSDGPRPGSASLATPETSQDGPSLTSTPSTSVPGSTPSLDTSTGYGYPRPEKPFPPSEEEGYDYPKPSKPFT